MNEVGKRYTMFWPVAKEVDGKRATLGMIGLCTHVWGESPRLCNLRLYWEAPVEIYAYNVPVDELDELE